MQQNSIFHYRSLVLIADVCAEGLPVLGLEVALVKVAVQLLVPAVAVFWTKEFQVKSNETRAARAIKH